MRSVPPSHLAVLALLVLAQMACGAFVSVASSDTSRDVFLAQQIAAGTLFPLSGPPINGMLYLGPLWYYVLAMPLWLVPNAASVTLTMGALSSTQFPLAYALGRRLATAHEGLLLALCLALPGWIVTSFGSLTHPVLALPSLLLGVFAVLAYRDRPDAGRAAVLGGAFVLMATAHPTLALPGVIMLAFCLPRAGSWLRLATHLALMAAIVALAFAPMAYEQWIAHPPDFGNASAWTRSEWSTPSLWAALDLLHAVVWYGPQYVTHFWLAADARVASGLFAVYVALLAMAAVGLAAVARRDAVRRRHIVWLAGLALLHAMFLCAIRDAMPPWMVYALWLPIAALLALGLAAWWPWRVPRMAILGLLAITTPWTLAVYAELASGNTQFLNILPSPGKRGFMDVRDYEEATTSFRVPRVPLRELYALGPPLCGPVTLYGHYAYQVDYTYAVSAAQACGSTRNVRLGGALDPARHAWLGLHRDVWTALAATPPRWLATLGVVPVDTVWHSPVPLAPVVPTLANFPRTFAGEARRFEVQGDAAPGQAVVVSHRATRYLPFDVLHARANGRDMQPVYRDITSVVFAPPPGASGTVHWQIEIMAHPDYVDVLPFPISR